jgi:hypothetical protein
LTKNYSVNRKTDESQCRKTKGSKVLMNYDSQFPEKDFDCQRLSFLSKLKFIPNKYHEVLDTLKEICCADNLLHTRYQFFSRQGKPVERLGRKTKGSKSLM